MSATDTDTDTDTDTGSTVPELRQSGYYTIRERIDQHCYDIYHAENFPLVYPWDTAVEAAAKAVLEVERLQNHIDAKMAENGYCLPLRRKAADDLIDALKHIRGNKVHAAAVQAVADSHYRWEAYFKGWADDYCEELSHKD
jgi:acyl-CoA synthetase (NDP forming)